MTTILERKTKNLYTHRFIHEVLTFSKLHKLFNINSHVVVSVSGGLDSMSLLFLFNELKKRGEIKELRAIHFNHGTRTGQKEDEKNVREFCSSLGVKLSVIHLQGLEGISNFEKKARESRYASLSKACTPQEIIALAHHLNDSFEWTMMQELKTSSLSRALWIPLKRKNFIRPFFCVSRKQIESFSKINKIPFVSDPTNKDLSYERNFIRNKIIPLLELKYPKYLKHYVRRQNKILSMLKKKETKKIDPSGFIIFASENSDFISKIKENLKKISDVRWRAGNQKTQIENMLKNNKVTSMSLPANFKLFSHSLYLGVLKGDVTFSLSLKESQKFNFLSFKKLIDKELDNFKPHHYPYFVGLKKLPNGVRRLKEHPLFKDLDALSIRHQLLITDSFCLLKWWSRAENNKKVLDLTILW